MKQLEIDFFFPLTEQISLDLDYTPCQEYAAERQRQLYSNSTAISIGNGGTWGAVTSNNISLQHITEFRPTSNSVGCWAVSPELNYYVSKEPNWFVKKMTKVFFGWEWKDK
jgi:hypothetical protein